MGDFILGKHGLSDQHVEQATESPLQGEFARVAIFMISSRLPMAAWASSLGMCPGKAFLPRC